MGGVGDTFEHDDDDVEGDEDEEPDVELFARRGVGFEDDGVDLLLGKGSIAFGEEDGEEGAVEYVANEVDDLPGDFGIGYADDEAYQGLEGILDHRCMGFEVFLVGMGCQSFLRSTRRVEQLSGWSDWTAWSREAGEVWR